jgi:adenine-specific DNA-methyltransferase
MKMLNSFIGDIEVIYDDIKNLKKPCLKGFKDKWNIKGSIGEVYQNLCKKDVKKETGSFYTPFEVVEFMVRKILDKIDYEQNPYIKILDPSCGGGYFLIYLIDGLVEKAKLLGFERPFEHVIKNNIFGFDIDRNAIIVTVIELYDKTGIYAENIRIGDFLTGDIEKFDLIIGNPPYMGHKVLVGEYRERLYDLYKDVFADKGDMSYCFIKRSIDSLKDRGVLVFFTSRYILEALNGQGIRRFILESGLINRIVDFYGVRFVKGAGVDNIILEFTKGPINGEFEYFRFKDSAKGIGALVFNDIEDSKQIYTKYIDVHSEDLRDEGWVFLDSAERAILNKIRGVEINNICDSYQGIITGCDRAFVLDKNMAFNSDIEKDLLKPWIKGKNIESFCVSDTGEVLIYSNLIDKESDYANAIENIAPYRERLEGRRECKNGARKWYELQWGRNEYIFNDKKIIYPYKSSRNRFAVDEGSFFSADVYAVRIKDMFLGHLSYEFLVGVLNSSIYEFYIKSMAKKLGDNLYEYYPNKIMTLKIPEYIKGIEDEVLRGGEDLRNRIDMILNDYFGLSELEYSIIKQWCY